MREGFWGSSVALFIIGHGKYLVLAYCRGNTLFLDVEFESAVAR